MLLLESINFFVLLVSLFLIFSAIMVILAPNPVHSVFFLILVVLCLSSLFLSFGIDFLGILLIVVYVGAIAVLFLFVVMMLNVRVDQTKESLIRYFPVMILLVFFASFEIYYFMDPSSFLSYFNLFYDFWVISFCDPNVFIYPDDGFSFYKFLRDSIDSDLLTLHSEQNLLAMLASTQYTGIFVDNVYNPDFRLNAVAQFNTLSLNSLIFHYEYLSRGDVFITVFNDLGVEWWTLLCKLYIPFRSPLSLDEVFDFQFPSSGLDLYMAGFLDKPYLLSEPTNIDAFGFLIYNYFALPFILVSIILLIAMIGPIVLTLDHKKSIKRQDIQCQVERDFNRTISLKI